MQQLCKTCGYESPDTDKFCRQCGGQLTAENEFTSAATLNHGQAEPNPPRASVGTGRFPPNVGDAIAANTERYYSPPQYAPAPSNVDRTPAYAPLIPTPAPRSWLRSFSRFMRGALIFLLFAGLVAMTATAVFFAEKADDARAELNRKNRSRNGREQANGRAQEAWEQMEEALQLTHEAAEKAAGAGATLTTGGEKQVDLGGYAYPDAQVEAMISAPGDEAISMITHKSLDDVQKFYEGRFGKPVLQVATQDWQTQRRKLLFQSPAPPSVLIKVEEIDRGRVKITILRSFLRFPRLNEVQAQHMR